MSLEDELRGMMDIAIGQDDTTLRAFRDPTGRTWATDSEMIGLLSKRLDALTEMVYRIAREVDPPDNE